MYEKLFVSPLFESFKLRDIPPYVLLSGPIDEEAVVVFREEAGKILGSGQSFLPVLIDSFGGDAYATIAIRDFIKSVESDIEVVTICNGKAMSAGALILASGTRRFASKGSVMLLHELAGEMGGEESKLEVQARELNRLSKQIYDGLDDDTGQPRGYWYDFLFKKKLANMYLTPRQAKKHKLITDIGLPIVETSVSVERHLNFVK